MYAPVIPVPEPLTENEGVCFQGSVLGDECFHLAEEAAERMRQHESAVVNASPSLETEDFRDLGTKDLLGFLQSGILNLNEDESYVW